MNELSERDHERSPVSNGESTSSERDNLVRYAPGARLGRGHVESHFLKANSPDGLRALWIKHTLLVRGGPREADVAEVWAVAFRRERIGAPVEKRAIKRSFPIATARIARAPFSIAAGGAELRQGHARALIAPSLSDSGGAWDLHYACPAEGFRPFPLAAMYTGRFPRSKSLTPVPSARVHGSFRLGRWDWDVRDFVLAQGHNWGESHAERYAWTQVNLFDAKGDAWLEALTGKVRVGPVTTPWLSVAALYVDGELHRFDGARALVSRGAHIDTRSYALTLRDGSRQLRFRISAESHAFAGLRYEDPNGSALACLNSKLAEAEVELTAHGRTRTLRSDAAALELGIRREDHGITMLV
jgi:hypothetical protein